MKNFIGGLRQTLDHLLMTREQIQEEMISVGDMTPIPEQKKKLLVEAVKKRYKINGDLDIVAERIRHPAQLTVAYDCIVKSSDGKFYAASVHVDESDTSFIMRGPRTYEGESKDYLLDELLRTFSL